MENMFLLLSHHDAFFIEPYLNLKKRKQKTRIKVFAIFPLILFILDLKAVFDLVSLKYE